MKTLPNGCVMGIEFYLLCVNERRKRDKYEAVWEPNCILKKRQIFATGFFGLDKIGEKFFLDLSCDLAICCVNSYKSFLIVQMYVISYVKCLTLHKKTVHFIVYYKI